MLYLVKMLGDCELPSAVKMLSSFELPSAVRMSGSCVLLSVSVVDCLKQRDLERKYRTFSVKTLNPDQFKSAQPKP